MLILFSFIALIGAGITLRSIIKNAPLFGCVLNYINNFTKMLTKAEFEIKYKLSNLSKIQTLWMSLVKREKCLYCGVNFEGIIKKHPFETKFELSAFYWFTPDYLAHCETTHGYSPETLTDFLCQC